MTAPRPEISVTLSPALLALRRGMRAEIGAETGAGVTAGVLSGPGPQGGLTMQVSLLVNARPEPVFTDPVPELVAEPDAVQPSIEVCAEPDPLAPRDRVRLRRDGARPLVFEGAALLAETDEANLHLAERPVTVRQHLALYLDADNRLVIAAHREIEGVEAVRPAHLACSLEDPAQLPRLFAGLDPWVLLLDPIGLAPSDAERGAMETFFGQAPRRLMSHLRGAVQQ